MLACGEYNWLAEGAGLKTLPTILPFILFEPCDLLNHRFQTIELKNSSNRAMICKFFILANN